MNQLQAQLIRAVCDWWDENFPELECDGLSRVLSYKMLKAHQPHAVMTGTLPNGIPHWWIESGDCVVDYRLKRWLGDDAAHGVFDLAGSVHESLPDRREAGWPKVPEWLFKILTNPPTYSSFELPQPSPQKPAVCPTPPETV